MKIIADMWLQLVGGNWMVSSMNIFFFFSKWALESEYNWIVKKSISESKIKMAGNILQINISGSCG